MLSPLYDPEGYAEAVAPSEATALYESLLVMHHRYLLDAQLPRVLAGAVGEALAALARRR